MSGFDEHRLESVLQRIIGHYFLTTVIGTRSSPYSFNVVEDFKMNSKPN